MNKLELKSSGLNWLCHVCEESKKKVVRIESTKDLYWICKKCLKKALNLFEMKTGEKE